MNKVVPLEFIDLLCFSHIECSCFSHFEGEFFEGDYESLFTFVEKYLTENYSLYEELSMLEPEKLTRCHYFNYYIVLPTGRPLKIPNEIPKQHADSPNQFFLPPNNPPGEDEDDFEEGSANPLHSLGRKSNNEKEISKNLDSSLHPQEDQLYQPAMNSNKLS